MANINPSQKYRMEVDMLTVIHRNAFISSYYVSFYFALGLVTRLFCFCQAEMSDSHVWRMP